MSLQINRSLYTPDTLDDNTHGKLALPTCATLQGGKHWWIVPDLGLPETLSHPRATYH